MKLYVGNLNFRCTEDDLRELFAPYGQIDDLVILNDRETGRSRGFGFITLADDAQAKQAVEDLHEKDFQDRDLVLNEARPRTERGGGGGGGGYSGGGGGRGGGGGGYSRKDNW